MGLLLGYLAEQQKKLRAERDVATRMLALVRMDAGLTGTLSGIVAELLKMYQTNKAIVASRESGTTRISVGILELKKGVVEPQWIDVGAHGTEIYAGDNSATAYYAVRVKGRDSSEFNIA